MSVGDTRRGGLPAWLDWPVLVLGVFCLGVLVGAMSLRRLESFDFWWQLRLGRYIAEFHEVPTRDILTYTVEGHPYVDSHWLFQWVLWHVYAWGGINGVILGVAGIAAVTWCLVGGAVAWHRRYGVALAVLAVGIVAGSERLVPRPDLVSIGFLAATNWALLRYRLTGLRAVLLLPMLQLLWVNMHGLWILGPVLVGMYLWGDLAVSTLPLPDGLRWWCLGPRHRRPLGVVWALMLAAAFITPQPLRQALYPVTLFTEIRGSENWVATSVTELGEPFAGPHWSLSEWAFLVLIVVLCVGWVRNWRRVDLTELVAVAAFGYLAFTARRNIPLFAVLAVPAAIRHWTPSAREGRGDKSAVGRTGVPQPVLAICAAVAALALARDAATNRLWQREGMLTRFGLGLSETQYPGRLGDFIRAANVPGPMWNTPALGGYLAWRFWPERRTYIDGRWEVFGQDFLQAYGEAVRNPELWQRRADEQGLESAVLFHRRPDFGPLLRYLQGSPQWALCYADQTAVLYVRRSQANADFVSAWEVPLTSAAVPSPLPDGPVVVWEDRFQGALAFPRLEAWLNRWPRRAPDGAVFALIGNLFFTLEADPPAAEWFARAVEQEPGNFAARMSLGYLAGRRGAWAESYGHYAQAAAARPWHVDAWVGAGDAALRTGDLGAAETAFREALDRDADCVPALVGLGRLAMLVGDRDAAYGHLARARALAPDAPAVRGLAASLGAR